MAGWRSEEERGDSYASGHDKMISCVFQQRVKKFWLSKAAVKPQRKWREEKDGWRDGWKEEVEKVAIFSHVPAFLNSFNQTSS